MKKDKVFFQKKEYTFPHELYEYIMYCREFQEDRDELLSLIFERIRCKIYQFPDEEFNGKLKNVCKTAIRCLGQNDIYNITENDLLKNNNGYAEFRKIENYAIEQMKYFKEKADAEYKEGYEKAYASAASQVTGSGLGLISNSIMAHMAFAAMESNTVRQQTAKAKKQLQNSLTSLSIQTGANREQREWNFVVNEIYPIYINIIEEFLSQVIDDYLSLLEKKGIFLYSEIHEFSITRSSELLKNLELVNNKSKVLEQAFECCPYNVNIYQKLVDMDLMDSTTESTLIFYEQKESLINSIKEKLDNIFSSSTLTQRDIELARKNLQYSAKLQNVNISEVEKAYFSEIQDTIENNIKYVYAWQFDDDKISQIDAKVDGSDFRVDVIERKLKNLIESQLLSDNSVKIYNLICGENFFRTVLKDNNIEADSLTGFVELMTHVLRAKIDENKKKKSIKRLEIYEQKQEKNKKRKNVCICIVTVLILIIATREIYYAIKRNEISKLCQQISNNLITFNKEDLPADSEGIKKAEIKIETGLVRYSYRKHLSLESNATITMYVDDDFDQLSTSMQYITINKLSEEASNFYDKLLKKEYPEYYEYVYPTDKSEEYLRKVFREQVDSYPQETIQIMTFTNIYKYVENEDYYLKNDKKIYANGEN